jgi:hypothetical protein
VRSATDGLEDINVKIIAIEEHWNSVNIRDALDRLQNGARDESVRQREGTVPAGLA